jgi:molecular chaperone HtpG
LELNPSHALVATLRTAHEQAPDDPGLVDTAKLLHGMALLAEGGELAEPAAFVAILSRRLEQTLS